MDSYEVWINVMEEFAMSWEKPKAKDISLAMECSSYSNADDFGVEEAPADPSFDF